MTLLNTYLSDKRISQSSIASDLEKSPSSIARVVNSKLDITQQNNILVIRSIARILNTTPGDILNELIGLESSLQSFNDERQYYIMTTIWNDDNSLTSDESYEYNTLDEACIAFDDLINSNRIMEKITFDLSMTVGPIDYIIMSSTLEGNNSVDSYTDNLDQLPDLLKQNVRQVAKQHAIKID